MGLRAEFELVAIISDVVTPALASVFKPGDVESVCVAWEEPIRLTDGSESAPTRLNLHLVCRGEQHTSNLWTVRNQTYDLDELRARLVDEFSTLLAGFDLERGRQR
jgi:hypothetical protein